MYLEEIKEQEEGGGSENKASNKSPPKNEDTISLSKGAISFSPTPHDETKPKQQGMMNHHNAITAAAANVPGNQSGFSLTDMEGMAATSPKRLRSSGCNEIMLQSINMEMKQREQRVGRDEYSFMGNLMGSFGQYPMDMEGGEGGRFDETEHHHHQQQQFSTRPRFSGGNNGVSLTLGLPHCENLSLSGAHHQGFLQNPNTVQIMGRQMNHDHHQFGGATNTAAAFEIQNNGKRFAAHLLHDFVA